MTDGPSRSNADALLKRGKLEAALEAYEAVIELEPGNGIAHQNAAVALADLRKYAEALEMAAKAAALDPSLVIPHSTMAFVCDALGDVSRSRREAAIALERAPDSPEALYCSGLLSLRDGDARRAVSYLERAVRLKPSFYLAQYDLAAAYQATHDARALARQVLVLLRHRPSVRNLFRLAYVLGRAYRFVALVLIMVAASLSPVTGTKGILFLTAAVMGMHILGAAFIGILAERRSLQQALQSILMAFATGVLGGASHFLARTFLQ